MQVYHTPVFVCCPKISRNVVVRSANKKRTFLRIRKRFAPLFSTTSSSDLSSSAKAIARASFESFFSLLKLAMTLRCTQPITSHVYFFLSGTYQVQLVLHTVHSKPTELYENYTSKCSLLRVSCSYKKSISSLQPSQDYEHASNS